MGSEFEVTREAAGNGVVVITVRGFLDAHTFERLEEAISQAFSGGFYRIVVDLAGVGYVSSAGAGVFIGALSEAQENGGNIVLLNPGPNVREVFELLGLTQIFQVVNDRRAALAAF